MKHKCYCSNTALTHCRCPRIGFPCSCTRYLDSPAARLESADSNTTSTLNTTPALDTRSASETAEEGLDTTEDSDTNEQLNANEEVESTPVSHLAQAPAGPCKGRCTIHGKCMCGGLTKCTCRHAGKTCSCVN
ncbi:hypothetical protein ASPACDRAFT_80013 [Aspergillus aculeatus ATCC 16872]|uniref:Uncharacterized protein n=1 Tax=Aspergillus aculeatus (strain ATCC 16872 / CBS 172.66 / WB 5094) TaxID=690307 RepID=A0A1L9WP06_ASPA1|nr:uncharacterized protein ASPACDRAFT_80013 [Aspergillus aculeatus ATCC 16872]OJJ97886.1 hypothetical protein ASPACDRAFT_80013 [Aspergillus aculeatus ATCC 16872]